MRPLRRQRTIDLFAHSFPTMSHHCVNAAPLRSQFVSCHLHTLRTARTSNSSQGADSQHLLCTRCIAPHTTKVVDALLLTCGTLMLHGASGSMLFIACASAADGSSHAESSR